MVHDGLDETREGGWIEIETFLGYEERGRLRAYHHNIAPR